jgi:hypothetical protein
MSVKHITQQPTKVPITWHGALCTLTEACGRLPLAAPISVPGTFRTIMCRPDRGWRAILFRRLAARYLPAILAHRASRCDQKCCFRRFSTMCPPYIRPRLYQERGSETSADGHGSSPSARGLGASSSLVRTDSNSVTTITPGTGSSTISTITVSSVAAAARLDDLVGRGPTFLDACLARSLIPSFLAFVFEATRLAAFVGVVFAPVRLAAFLGAESTFLPTFPRFEAAPFRANARSFRLAMTVSH